jgi:hypothetical protein
METMQAYAGYCWFSKLKELEVQEKETSDVI